MEFKSRIFHEENEKLMLEERHDGSFFLQYGMAGFFIKTKDDLNDLRNLLDEAFYEEDEEIYRKYFR